MALTDESGSGNGFYMPVAPANGGSGFGNDWGWIILLLLFAGGGWGNGFGGAGNMMLGYDFPWLLNGQNGVNANVNTGFQNAMLNDNITSIRDGISGLATQICGATGDISTQLCNGFNGVNASINGAQSALAQQMYTNQIADLERSFAAQTASTQGMSAIQSQLAQCCCDNRLATAQTQALVQSENCADRAALSDGIRDLITNQNAGVQRILDQMCNDKIDSKNEKIAELQNQLTIANLAASQTAQTAQILADNNRQTTTLEQYLNPAPIPAYVVSNPNCCNQNYGCGC